MQASDQSFNPGGNKTIVGDVIDDVSKHIEGVNIIRWGVIPGIVVAIIILLFIIFVIQPKFTGSSPMNVCNSVRDPKYPNDPNRNITGTCREEMIGNWWKLPLTLFVSGAMGASAGFGCYKLGLAYYNPKAAAGIVGMGLFSNSVRGIL